jgi:hypothetical protein
VNKDKEKTLKRRKRINLPQRRFGFIAIEKGFIKADQLYEALIKQRAQETGGAERRPLGMILKDLGYLQFLKSTKYPKRLKLKQGRGKIVQCH